MSQLSTAALIQGIWELGNWKRFREHGFLRNVLVVMSGAAISQIIGFAFSPILSRLFGPTDFGLFGTFAAASGIIGTAATLNYTDALMLPAKEEEAAPLFLFACLSSMVIALATGALCLLAPATWLRLLGIDGLAHYLWVLPVSVLFLALAHSLMVWCSRLKAFKETSQSQVLRSVTACVAQAAGGLGGLGGVGLMGAAVIGEASTTAFLGRTALRLSGRVLRTSWCWGELWRKAREYREFAVYGCPQNVLNALSQGIPVLALAHYYGAAVAGSYAFGHKLLQAPVNLVSAAMRPVLFQKLSQLNTSGNDLYLAFLKSTGALIAVGFVPFCIGFLAAPSLFAIVFGEEWREAGHYARWLILWLSVVFCNVPSTLALRILRLQRDLFLFDLLHLLVRIAALVLGGLWLGALKTVAILGLLGALFNVVLIVYVGLRLRNRLPIRVVATSDSEQS